MPAYLVRKQYCHKCKKSYDKITDHPRDKLLNILIEYCNKTMLSNGIKVIDCNFIGDELQNPHKGEFVLPNDRRNMVIAASTTARAMLNFYSVLVFQYRLVIYVSNEVDWELRPGLNN